MKNIRVYQPETFEVGHCIQLNKTSSNHLVKVLRLKNNFTFTLFNGNGIEYNARLSINGKKVSAHIESSLKTDNESNLKIHLIQGVSKGDRMDFAIQKAVELGITSITPVITERTVVNLKNDRQQKKWDHWQAIIISACEQSGRNIIPTLNQICDLSELVETTLDGLPLVLDPLSSISLQPIKSEQNIHLLIGPEGGLTEAEIDKAKSKNFTAVQLGPRILRTETAALAAITSVQLLWGDLK